MSQPKGWDFLPVMLQAWPMRCRNCEHRFYCWPWSAHRRHGGSAWRRSRLAEPLQIAAPPQVAALMPQARAAAASAGRT